MGKKRNTKPKQDGQVFKNSKIIEHKQLSYSYWGESTCQGQTVRDNTKIDCTNKAYFLWNKKLLCGVHSRQKQDRIKLLKNPHANQLKDAKIENHQQICESAAKQNKTKGVKGSIMCSKMNMMKDIGFVTGYINIFPNFKHGNRRDGIGLPSLSPKNIGPVDHGQPGLPLALNLENFHQGNKVYFSQVDASGTIKQDFFENQRKMYQDPIPHRHKVGIASKQKPLYSVWIDKEGQLRKITYFESRQFYCIFYERAVIDHPDFIMLKRKIADGYNLRICGYDGYDPSAKTTQQWFRDTSRPFGHQLVLYTMLAESQDRWPWNKYKQFQF